MPTLKFFVAAAAGTFTDANGKLITVGAPSDSNNGTSWATPYATLSKALQSARSDGLATARTIWVAPGAFPENTDSAGRWIPWGDFSATQTIRALSPDRTATRVTAYNNANGGAIDLTTSKISRNILIVGLTVEAPISGTDGATASGPFAISMPTISTINTLRFYRCRLVGNRWSTQKEVVHASGTTPSANIQFFSCTFEENITLNPNGPPLHAFSLLPSGLNDLFTNFVLDDCSFDLMGGFGLQAQGLNGFTITRCNFQSQTSYALEIGQDGPGTGYQPNQNGYIAGNFFRSRGSHAVLIGGGTTSTIVSHNDVDAADDADQGVVVKDASYITVKNNRIVASGMNVITALYNKGANHCTYTDNVIVARSGFAWRESQDQVVSQQASATTFTGNRIVAFGSSIALSWETPTGGGAVANDNIIELHDSATLGTIRTASIDTQIGDTHADKIRAAWLAGGGTGETANDSRTLVSTDPSLYTFPVASPSTSKVYAQIWNMQGKVWNGTAFESYDGTKPFRYARPGYELGTVNTLPAWEGGGVWAVPIPQTLPEGDYVVTVYQQGSGGFSPFDTRLADRNLPWTGRTVVQLDAISKSLSFIASQVI